MFKQHNVKESLKESLKTLYQINLKRELIFTGSCELTLLSLTEQKSDIFQSSTDLQVYCQP